MLLLELFDKPIDGIEFDKHHVFSKYHDYTYSFSVGGQKYEFKCTIKNFDDDGNLTYELQFSSEDTGRAKYSNTGRMGTASIEVFSKVIQIALKFIEEHKPSAIEFTGYKADNRDKLYNKMVTMIMNRVPNASLETKAGGNGSSEHIDFIIHFDWAS